MAARKSAVPAGPAEPEDRAAAAAAYLQSAAPEEPKPDERQAEEGSSDPTPSPARPREEVAADLAAILRTSLRIAQLRGASFDRSPATIAADAADELSRRIAPGGRLDGAVKIFGILATLIGAFVPRPPPSQEIVD